MFNAEHPAGDAVNRRPEAFDPVARSYADEVAIAIRDHQAGITDWEFHSLAGELHRWVEIFDSEFKLNLPSYPVIRFRPIGGAYGTYRAARDELGTKDNITLNENELSRGPALVLATLCHELLHLWQRYRGSPPRSNWHNREFRERAFQCGLVVDSRGCHTGYTSVFALVLSRYGIDFAKLGAGLELPAERLYGSTVRQVKMAKWSCACTRVRCAIDLQATCNRCDTRFDRGEHVIKGSRK